ncbi:hypothetical protein Kazakh3190_14010 [Helicobacter pylori]
MVRFEMILGENMGNKDHSKGSSWHKWDLHAHTPYTHLNRAYQCLEEDFIQKLCDSKIDCIGLTNYFKFKPLKQKSQISLVFGMNALVPLGTIKTL